MTAQPTAATAAWQDAWAEYVAHLLACRACTAEHCSDGARLFDTAEAARFRAGFGRAA